jgi:hypothetical protein
VLRRVRKKGSDGALYECQCECGTRRVVTADAMRRGASLSCGACVLRKQICHAGHDTSILGRSECGTCRACVRSKRLLTLYGITLEEYARLWEFQAGKCPICGTSLQGPNEIGKPGFGNGVRVEVDHDHTAGLTPRQAVRGLLCGGRWKGCNRRIGGGVDNAPWLRRVLDYLTNPPAQAFIRGLTK